MTRYGRSGHTLGCRRFLWASARVAYLAATVVGMALVCVVGLATSEEEDVTSSIKFISSFRGGSECAAGSPCVHVRVSTGLQRVCSAGAFIYLAVTMVLMLLFLRLSVQWPAVVGALKRLERRLVVGEYPFIDLRPRIRITTIVVLSANFLSEHSISKTYKGSVLRNTNILCPPQLK